jgi:hypothetical protein
MKMRIAFALVVLVLVSRVHSASTTGAIVNILYSVNKVSTDNYIHFNVKNSTGGVVGFAIPLSGGTYSLAPATPFSEQEASRIMSLLLTAKSTGAKLEVSYTRTWNRPSGAGFQLVDAIELLE